MHRRNPLAPGEPPPITVRPAQPDDGAALSPLLDEIARLERRAGGRAAAEPPTVVAPADGVLLVAEQPGQGPVGLASLRLEHPVSQGPGSGGPVAVLDRLVVRRPSRRMGIGGLLLAHAEAWARAAGAERVELGVPELNRDAIRFYEATGYQTALRRMTRALA